MKQYKTFCNLNFMGIVYCDEIFKPYVPENEDLRPILHFRWGCLKLQRAQRLMHLLDNICKRLNNNTIYVKPYLTLGCVS